MKTYVLSIITFFSQAKSRETIPLSRGANMGSALYHSQGGEENNRHNKRGETWL